MAAIDFPNSPTLNQEFTANGRTWIWNGTVWANKVSNTSVSRYNVSDTAPSSPASGDVWFNSTNARTYVYYDSFWVESNPALDGKSGVSAVASPITNSGTQSAAVLGLDYNSLQYGQNHVVNGNFDIFQRVSFTNQTASNYCLDRWYAGVGGTITITQQTTGVPIGSKYCARIAYNAANSFANLFQAFESGVTQSLAGQTVTISAKVRANAAWAATASQSLTLFLEKNSTADTLTGGTWSALSSAIVLGSAIQTGTSSTSWTTLSTTITIPSDGTAAGLRIHLGEGVAGPSGAYYEVSQVKLEVGQVATPFKRAGGTIQGELAACQRYYYRMTASDSYGHMALGGSANSTTGAVIFPFPVTMRTAPTAIDYASLMFAEVGLSGIAVNSVTLPTDGRTTNSCNLNINVSSGLTQFRTARLLANNTVGAYIGFLAEL